MTPELTQSFSQFGQAILLSLGALLPIVNPFGSAIVFLSLTPGYPSALRNALARKVALNGFFLLLGSALIGSYVLRFFGISIPVVQVGGGMVVLSAGWAMLNQKDLVVKAQGSSPVAPEQAMRQAFYPLTLPLTIGPGSISVAITLGANQDWRGFNNAFVLASTLITAVIVAALVFLCIRFAEPIAKRMGETAMSVLLRLSSFILLCIGVQIVWNGLTALLKTMPR